MDTRDPVRAYLNSVLEYRVEARRLRQKISALEDRATSITSQVTGMPRGGSADSGAVLAALADATAEYYQKLIEVERKELEVAAFIDSLPSDTSRMILKLHYVDRKHWPQVLRALTSAGYKVSERKMYRLHGRALEEARLKMKEINHDES